MEGMKRRLWLKDSVTGNFIGLLIVAAMFIAGLIMALPSIVRHKTDYGPPHVILLSTGGTGSPYSITGEFIAQHFDAVSDSIRVLPILSSGSLQNIERLDERTADLAIVQRDVLIDAYYDEANPTKNLVVLYPLFEEKLQIFIRDTSGVISVSEFIKMVKQNRIKSFDIGAPGSSTNYTTRKLFSLLGQALPQHILQENGASEAITAFEYGTLDAFAFFAASPIPGLSELNCESISLLSLSSDECTLILDRLSNLDKATLNQDDYPFLVDKSISWDSLYLVGTWAFLVGLEQPVKMVRELVGGPIVGHLNEASNQGQLGPYVKHVVNVNLRSSKVSISSPVGLSNHSTGAFFKGLRVSNEYSRMPYRGKLIQYVVFAAFLVLFFALYRIAKRHYEIDYRVLWYRYRHFALSLSLFVGMYFLITGYVVNREYDYFRRTGIKSEILDLTHAGLRQWLLLYVITGREANVFPISQSATIAVAAAFNLFWFLAFTSVGSELVVNHNLKKRRMGNKRLKVSNHHVICGWNDRCTDFIRTALYAKSKYLGDDTAKIVLVNTALRDKLEKDEFLSRIHSLKKIEFVHGDATNRDVLKAAQVDKASTVVLLPDDLDKSADERTLLRALSISKYCRSKGNKVADSIYMIAELNSEKYREDMYSADVNEVVCVGEMSNSVVVQGMFNHGVSDALAEILSYNEYNEFYTIDCRVHKSLRGKTYDELLTYLRAFGVLLLGIKIVHYDKEGNERIDRDQLKKRNKKKYGVDRNILINPCSSEELGYSTDDDDQLLVFAFNKKVIEKIP